MHLLSPPKPAQFPTDKLAIGSIDRSFAFDLVWYATPIVGRARLYRCVQPPNRPTLLVNRCPRSICGESSRDAVGSEFPDVRHRPAYAAGTCAALRDPPEPIGRGTAAAEGMNRTDLHAFRF